MVERHQSKLPRREAFGNTARVLGKLALYGGIGLGIGWVGHELVTSGPVHVSVHDFSTGHWSYGWHTGLSVDHVSASQITNGHQALAQVSIGDIYHVQAGTEYTVQDTTPGSHNSFDILLDRNSPLANYHFQPGHTYDFQGQNLNELIGQTPTGKDIVTNLIDVSKITDEGVSTANSNLFASFNPLVGGAIAQLGGIKNGAR